MAAIEAAPCDHVTASREIRELPGTIGWVVTRCKGSEQLWLVGENVRPVFNARRLDVTGFMDLDAVFHHLERVGEQFKLSPGPHHQQRPGMVLLARRGMRQHLVVVDVATKEPTVAADIVVRACGRSRSTVDILQDPSRLEAHHRSGEVEAFPLDRPPALETD